MATKTPRSKAKRFCAGNLYARSPPCNVRNRCEKTLILLAFCDVYARSRPCNVRHCELGSPHKVTSALWKWLQDSETAKKRWLCSILVTFMRAHDLAMPPRPPIQCPRCDLQALIQFFYIYYMRLNGNQCLQVGPEAFILGYREKNGAKTVIFLILIDAGPVSESWSHFQRAEVTLCGKPNSQCRTLQGRERA